MRRPSRQLVRSGVPLFATLLIACGEAPDGGAALEGEAARIARGKHYYQSVCTACHSGDPTADGALGPALAGTSLPVLQAKVLRGEYPEGYTPKRDTGSMPRFQYLEPELENIAAYLSSVEGTKRTASES